MTDQIPLSIRQLELENWMARATAPESVEATARHMLQNHLLSTIAEPYLAVVRTTWETAQRRPGRAADLMAYFPDQKALDVCFLEALALMLSTPPTHGQVFRFDLASAVGKRIELCRILVCGAFADMHQQGLRLLLHGDLGLDLVRRRLLDKGCRNGHAWHLTHLTRRALGVLAVEALAAASPLITIASESKAGSGRSHLTIRYADAYWDLFARWRELRFLHRPSHMPMLVPPRPWTSQTDGGYVHTVSTVLPCEEHLYLPLMREAQPVVLDAINTLQRSPYTLDEWMLDVAHATWRLGHEIGSLPGRERAQPPADHEYRDRGLGPQAFWKATYRWRADRAKDPQRGRFLQAMVQAEQYEPGDPLHFVHHLDYRGRMYPRSAAISPQGSDLMRSFLQWHQQAPVAGNEQALAYVLGEHAGVVADRHERLAWMSRHRDEIDSAGRDPFGPCQQFWSGMKNPWRFLQAARQFHLYLKDRDHRSGLVAQLDQTTSGYGIVACLTNDEELAAEANVIGSIRGDIYGRMREACRAQAKALVRNQLTDERTSRALAWWLERWPDRAAFKAVVMPVIYGSKFQSANAYCLDLARSLVGDITNDEGVRTVELGKELARLILSVTKDKLASVRDLDRILSHYCRAHADQQQDVTWYTPSGMLIRRMWREKVREQFALPIAGRRVLVRSTTHTTWRRPKHWSGVTADFVHGIDASFAHRFVTHWAGISQAPIGCTHDCFSTDLSHLGMLSKELHDQFARMWQEQSPLFTNLERLRLQGAKLPLVNAWPDFINRVGENPYLFS